MLAISIVVKYAQKKIHLLLVRRKKAQLHYLAQAVYWNSAAVFHVMLAFRNIANEICQFCMRHGLCAADMWLELNMKWKKKNSHLLFSVKP